MIYIKVWGMNSKYQFKHVTKCQPPKNPDHESKYMAAVGIPIKADNDDMFVCEMRWQYHGYKSKAKNNPKLWQMFE